MRPPQTRWVKYGFATYSDAERVLNKLLADHKLDTSEKPFVKEYKTVARRTLYGIKTVTL